METLPAVLRRAVLALSIFCVVAVGCTRKGRSGPVAEPPDAATDSSTLMSPDATAPSADAGSNVGDADLVHDSGREDASEDGDGGFDADTGLPPTSPALDASEDMDDAGGAPDVGLSAGRACQGGNLDAGCSVDCWCWEHPRVTNNRLNAVWGSSPRDVWAAGPQNTVVHWDGTAWEDVVRGVNSLGKQRLFPSGDGLSVGRIGGIWGASPESVWFVGSARSPMEFRSNVALWDGAKLGGLRSGPVTPAALNGIWGAAADDAWIVGDQGTLLRWDGRAWTAVQSPTKAHLFGVGGSGPNDVWAVGDQGTIVHWNGTNWSTAESGTTMWLSTVWVGGPGDAWAAGNGATLLHWDGHSWTGVSNPSPQALQGVWGRASDDVWAVGRRGTLLHWNGTAWSLKESGTIFDLWAIGGVGGMPVAVGDSASILRYSP